MAKQTATFLGGSKALVITDKGKSYAYSGTLVVAGATVTALEFMTPKKVIYAKFFMNYDSAGFGAGERIGYNVLLNNIEIVSALYGDNVTSPTSAPYELELILPPLTNVKVTLTSSDSSDISMGMVMIGDVL